MDREAKVIEGARGPIIDLASLPNAGAEVVVDLSHSDPEGTRTFVSNSKNLRIQVKREFKRVIGDEVLTEPHRIVQFVGGVYKTADEMEIKALEKNKGYRLGGLFWDAHQAQAIAEEAEFQSFMIRVQSNPALERKVRERLKVDARLRDFMVPPVEDAHDSGSREGSQASVIPPGA